jgi:hypothetical protein
LALASSYDLIFRLSIYGFKPLITSQPYVPSTFGPKAVGQYGKEKANCSGRKILKVIMTPHFSLAGI